jgi:hypothetical protein
MNDYWAVDHLGSRVPPGSCPTSLDFRPGIPYFTALPEDSTALCILNCAIEKRKDIDVDSSGNVYVVDAHKSLTAAANSLQVGDL